MWKPCNLQKLHSTGLLSQYSGQATLLVCQVWGAFPLLPGLPESALLGSPPMADLPSQFSLTSDPALFWLSKPKDQWDLYNSFGK